MAAGQHLLSNEHRYNPATSTSVDNLIKQRLTGHTVMSSDPTRFGGMSSTHMNSLEAYEKVTVQSKEQQQNQKTQDDECYSLEVLKEKHAQLQDVLMRRDTSRSSVGGDNNNKSTNVSIMRQNQFHRLSDRQFTENTELNTNNNSNNQTGYTRGMLFDSSHDNYDYHSSNNMQQHHGNTATVSQPEIVTLMPKDAS